MAPPEPLTPLADHTQLPVADFAANGVAILPDVLSGSEVAALRTACDSCLEQWKASSTAHNQPSAYCWGPEAWILIHLNHPDFFASDATRPFLPRILNAVASPAILSGLRKIFGVDDMGGPDCTIRQINYYIDPPRQGRPPNWHRDSQFFAGGDNELERRTIAEEANPTREVHVHIPLLPTTHSGFVPGSHLRWDTPEEHRVRMAVDEASGTRGCGEIQGGCELQLEPGDASIFHVNGLHRGRYDVGYMRRTIAITVGDNERPRWEETTAVFCLPSVSLCTCPEPVLAFMSM